jgi:filamentous hemagglutinin
VGSVTASAADVLRLQDGVLTLRRSARTVYIQAAPADSPAGAGPLASASLAPAPEAAERQLQAALDQLLQSADQARTAGLLVATGDPPPAEVSGGADAPSTAEGSIRALGTAEAFLAFSPAGKLLSGLASGATDWVSAPIALGREAVLTTSDVLRHLGSAATGLPDGGAGNWAPESALGRIVASEGLLGAAGWAVTGTVRGMLAPLDSLYRQDLEALGRSLPGAALAMAPLGWGSRVSAAEGLSVEELALVASGNAARSRIIDSVSVAAQPSIEAITLLDPSAVIGFRGSLASGLKHDTKLGRDLQRVAYDQDVFYLRDPVTSDLTPYQGVQGYDIDLFAISDRLASGFRAQDWFRDLGSKHEGLRATFAELDQVLRADPSMARLKPGGVEFRVFTQDEINRRIARGDRPYYFNTRQLP